MATQFPYLSGEAFQKQKQTIQQLEDGDYIAVLSSAIAKSLLSDSADNEAIRLPWRVSLESNISKIRTDEQGSTLLFLLGQSALQAFLQSNVTGPPLNFRANEICFPGGTEGYIAQTRRELISDLSVDGEAIYALTPDIELFYLAQRLSRHGLSPTSDAEAWTRLRVNFWHQKMLNEGASALQDAIYKDLTFLEGFILGKDSDYSDDARALFLLERAAIHTFHGFDAKARADLDEAARLRKFQYILTGRLGKRTKFQQNDLSQLVVLAKSYNSSDGHGTDLRENGAVGDHHQDSIAKTNELPSEIELNDDTLLERYSFAPTNAESKPSNEVIPPALEALDPSSQPILEPPDAAVLLAFATAITNTSPEHGLTREETRPYATRVIEGGSSNWQVYTQALLVRSRIEAHKARTVERGVLQLQALVDQIIAETSGAELGEENSEAGPTTFLPRAKPSESAPASERLKFIHQLSTPPRWSLEAELASRWASLGGLLTALDIFERLQMWAEASLCLAATDQENKAIRMVRRQLYQPSNTEPRDEAGDSSLNYTGAEHDPLPVDAPRLFCILGDLEKGKAIEHYERAWEVSKQRYSRAKRSIGKIYVAQREFEKADEAYSAALTTNPQNGGTWFALGCVRLELGAWKGAVQAFQRCVHTEPEDGEAWSNLAAALVHLSPTDSLGGEAQPAHRSDIEGDVSRAPDPQRHVRAALVAFKRAATFKRDSYRIWQNVLTVAMSLDPPAFADLIIAQTRLIELRGATEGEGSIDAPMLEGVLSHIVATSDVTVSGADGPRGLERMFAQLVTQRVVPLITRSRRLWQLVARLALHQKRPATALDAYEKAWRAMLNQPGWDDGSQGKEAKAGDEDAWTAVRAATEELVDAYESLGERETTEGLAAGTGQLVCSNWKFKARTAVRSVVSRRSKGGYEDAEELRTWMNERGL